MPMNFFQIKQQIEHLRSELNRFLENLDEVDALITTTPTAQASDNAKIRALLVDKWELAGRDRAKMLDIFERGGRYWLTDLNHKLNKKTSRAILESKLLDIMDNKPDASEIEQGSIENQ